MTLKTHIVRLVKRSGWNFTFLYLKESQRLLIRALSGSPETVFHSGICVSRDSHGFPRILPLNIRLFLSEYKSNQSKVKAVLTLLSIYRVFPTKPKPKLDTITDPFIGVSERLSDLRPAVREIFGVSEFKLGNPRLIKLETAGPNASKSAWSSSIDVLAFIHYPAEFFHFVRYCLFTKTYRFLAWSLGLIFVAILPYTLLLVLKRIKPLKLGKLGVVLDQAGKARIIAICSY
jgi:hypothetical protein